MEPIIEESENEGFSVTLIIILLGIALALGVFFMMRGVDDDVINPPVDNGGVVDNDDDDNGAGTGTPPLAGPDQVKVTSPIANAGVRSPLTVRGEARGNWFFEASFPIKVLDANGKQLGISYVQAEGEWMTTNFVPFSGTISFATSTTPVGILVLEKDNPSGLPQNSAEVRIPIRFEQTNPQTRNIKLYFYNESRDRSSSGMVLCSAKGLVEVNRTIPLTNTPIQDAIKELLKGPSNSERLQAPDTEFPLSGVILTSASLSNGVLTLTFADPQNKTGGGSCRVNILRAMIEATAKQFGGVNSVQFRPVGVFEP